VTLQKEVIPLHRRRKMDSYVRRSPVMASFQTRTAVIGMINSGSTRSIRRGILRRGSPLSIILDVPTGWEFAKKLNILGLPAGTDSPSSTHFYPQAGVCAISDAFAIGKPDVLYNRQKTAK